MRIIDKNTDFYDYWQGIYRDDSVVFDRTDSFVLTKDMMCDHLHGRRWNMRDGKWESERSYFVLLQVCHTFWLFLADATVEPEYYRTVDFTAELVTKWQNHNRKRSLIKLDVISFDWSIHWLLCGKHGRWQYDKSRVMSYADTLAQAIDQNNYHIDDSVDKHVIYRGDNIKVEKHIPLLKASGFAGCIDPLDVYLALEEYFSLEKSDMERTESVGITDEDKIGNHGFDLKTSFRGK